MVRVKPWNCEWEPPPHAPTLPRPADRPRRINPSRSLHPMPAAWSSRRSRLWALALVATATAVGAAAVAFEPADLRPDYQPAVYAIKGARLVVSPGKTIENGTVVVREGVIEAV